MIALARADARRFRAVARRGFPTGRRRSPAPVRLAASDGTVTLAALLGEVVVALRAAAPKPGKGTVVVPLDALELFERGTGVVTLAGSGRKTVTARWDDGPAPRSVTVDQMPAELDWPAETDHLISLPPTFPRALHEAGRCADRDPDQGRYAVTRVQVRGKDGELVGTDGKQALVWGGFTFPFSEHLLVPAVPLFGSRELAGEAAVSVGLAKDWLSLIIGPWRIWLWVDREGRFPDVRGAIPRASGTRVTFDDRDVAAMLHALPGLPAGAAGKPVTLDLGQRVAVRTRAGESGPVAEVPLPFTAAAGPPVRVVLDRDHLNRALVLGLRELRVSSPERPAVFQDQDRLYLAATLDPSCAVPPSAAVADATVLLAAPASSPSPAIPIPVRSDPMPRPDDHPAGRNGHVDPIPAGDPADPLAEAEALRAALAEAATRAHRLVALLKQFRKERRSLQAAWSSLRQLNLGP
jgi:hypothetical protein